MGLRRVPPACSKLHRSSGPAPPALSAVRTEWQLMLKTHPRPRVPSGCGADKAAAEEPVTVRAKGLTPAALRHRERKRGAALLPGQG